tara:strand:- start:1223 stop:1492 length:270 start_codon:yes stop_codon:yes gene_type:complete
LDINMPLYTFKNLETNEEYDEVMSYDNLIKYLKQDNIQQVFKFNMLRYSDGGGMKDQFTDWCKESSVKGKGDFKPYGKAAKGIKQKGEK